jgi:hypothetical protein
MFQEKVSQWRALVQGYKTSDRWEPRLMLWCWERWAVMRLLRASLLRVPLALWTESV